MHKGLLEFEKATGRCSSGVEQLIRNEQVVGSIPTSGSTRNHREFPKDIGDSVRKGIDVKSAGFRWFPLVSAGFRRIPKNGAFLATDLATISGFLNKSTADISGVVADDLGNE